MQALSILFSPFLQTIHNKHDMSSPKKGVEDDSISQSSSEDKSHDRIGSIVPGAIIKDAELVTARGNVVTKEGVVISTAESDDSLSSNIFRDPEIKAYYIGVYEEAQYECRHVFDADLEWTQEEERKLIRKLDVRGMFMLNLL